MSEQRWKKGDEVAVIRGDKLIGLRTVSDVTPTGLLRVWGDLYRPDGHARSGDWPRLRLVAPTAAHRETVERAALWSCIRNAREEQHHLVDTATLRRVVDMLDGKAST